ncbi:hypothetical protein D3C87_1801210 [compost metagenome]
MTAAISRPAMIIGLRPILSDSPPKMTKNGVPRKRAMATMMLADSRSTFSTFCRKNRA